MPTRYSCYYRPANYLDTRGIPADIHGNYHTQHTFEDLEWASSKFRQIFTSSLTKNIYWTRGSLLSADLTDRRGQGGGGALSTWNRHARSCSRAGPPGCRCRPQPSCSVTAQSGEGFEYFARYIMIGLSRKLSNFANFSINNIIFFFPGEFH